jgi:PAS domain S-box-containing protein
MITRPQHPVSPSGTSRFSPAESNAQRNQIILEGQKQALETAVNGASLLEVLDILALCAEHQSSSKIYAAILLFDNATKRLKFGSAPSLPTTYRDLITNVGADICGSSMIDVNGPFDILHDQSWKEHKDFAVKHGFRFCWSSPILSSSNQLLAKFIVYYPSKHSITKDDHDAIELLSTTAGIIIGWFSEINQRKKAEDALRETDQHLRALMKATSDVVYRMSPDWKQMRTLLGQNFLEDTVQVIDDWQDKYIQPEDRPMVNAAIRKAINNKTVFQLEHRVVQADGTIGWTFSRAIPILDNEGKITEWFGAASDITERKRNESSLAETLSLLQSILKNAPVGYALFNDNFEYIQVNAALAEMNGISAEAHIGKTVKDIFPNSYVDLLKILESVFKTATPVHNVEIKGPLASRPNVDDRSWLTTFYPVVIDGSKEVKYVGAAVLEITDRVKTEKSLRESEKQFRDFSNSIQNLAWMAHGDGSMYWYNQRWYDYTGTTLDEMLGWGWVAVHHPDHVTRTSEFIRKAWQRGEQWELTFPLRGKDGEYKWFLTRAYPIKDEKGKVTRWIGTNTDIDEKLKIQEQLRQSQAQLRQISDFMPQIVWSTDAQGFHDFFNNRWYEFTGLTYEDTQGEQWIQVVHPDDRERTMKIWSNCLATGKTYETEYRMKKFDGEYRWLLARAIPLRRPDGTIERWFGTCTDIQDQKTMASRLETLVQERTKELSRSNEDLQQFAHVASHDLKEPVRKIQFFESIVSGQFADTLPKQVNVYLEKIRKSANRIASMIESVLAYSSMDGSTIMIEDIDLNEIIKNAAVDLELALEEKKVILKYDKLPTIKGIHALIGQLVYNLINNSIKFSSPARQPMITVNAKQVEAQGKLFHEIILQDNGIGFDNSFAESIFTAFTRLNPKDQYEGSGMGLALCKKIVERHGGTIRAIGKPDEGATFIIRLPVREN